MVSNIVLSAYAWAKSLPTIVVEAVKQENGQDLVEYGVLAGFIGIALAIAFIAAPIDMGTFATAVANCVNITNNPYACP